MKLSRILHTAAALSAAGAVFLSGCSVKFGTNRKISDDAVVAQPTAQGAGDDDMNIKYLDFIKEYKYYLKGQSITDDTAESVASQCENQRATIINYLINEKIILAKAKELGISTLSDEEMDAVEEEFNELVAEQVEYFGENADYGTISDSSSISDEEKQKRGNEMFDEYLADCGLDRDDLLMWQVSAKVTEKVKSEATKDVTTEYSEAQDKFDSYVESIKVLYADDVTEYESGSYSAFWVPEGSRRIKHILLGFSDTLTDEISASRENGDDAGADRLRSQAAEDMQVKLDEVMEQIDSGAAFDDLITLYSSDLTGSSINPDGYLLVPDGQSFMAEFKQAAFEMEKVGDITTCVTDYGIHIMQYAADAVVTDEEIKSYVDYIYETLDESKKENAFSEMLSEWKNEYSYEIDYDALNITKTEETEDSDAA